MKLGLTIGGLIRLGIVFLFIALAFWPVFIHWLKTTH